MVEGIGGPSRLRAKREAKHLMECKEELMNDVRDRKGGKG